MTAQVTDADRQLYRDLTDLRHTLEQIAWRVVRAKADAKKLDEGALVTLPLSSDQRKAVHRITYTMVDSADWEGSLSEMLRSVERAIDAQASKLTAQ